MASSHIEWTEMTWNPSTGCTKISAGCKYCYAEVMTRRLEGMGIEKYKDGFKLRIHEDALNVPYTWKHQKVVFVNSMSDLFHKDVPLSFIQKVFNVMNNTQHVYQVLTKRAEVLFRYDAELNWGHKASCNTPAVTLIRTNGNCFQRNMISRHAYNIRLNSQP